MKSTELKGRSAPKLNSTPAQTEKQQQQQKELWKNPLVSTAKNFPSNKPKYA